MNHAWGENRILTHLETGRKLYRAFMKGDKLVEIPAPKFISCWVSEVCNLDCTYCYFSETNHDKSHLYIVTDRFCDWLSEARSAGAESLEFSGGGEPTLHPDFEFIARHAKSLGYELGIITHACNPMNIEFMAKNFKYVRCGLDASTMETHDLIKRNKRKNYWFPKAIENVKALVKARDELNPKGFTVGIKIVLNKINFKEIRSMIDMAISLKVNYIQIKREHSSGNDLSPDECERVSFILKSWLSGNDSRFTKVLGTMNHAEATTKCFMSPVHTVVTATGKILQCCFFENRPIGTIYQPFAESWGSEAHRKVVEMTTVKECAKVDCRWNYYNRRMKEVIEDPLASASFI